MSDHDGFDAQLAAHFEQAHRQVPGDAFVADTMHKVRAERRRREFIRVGSRLAVPVAAVVASPWLIAGVARVNAAFELFLSSDTGQFATWALGALAVLAVLVTRVRSR
jgi:hypothetical protein